MNLRFYFQAKENPPDLMDIEFNYKTYATYHRAHVIARSLKKCVPRLPVGQPSYLNLPFSRHCGVFYQSIN